VTNHPTPVSDQFLVLHTLAIGGLIDDDEICERSGLASSVANLELRDLEQLGLARRRDGRMAGWMLNEDGRARHVEFLATARGDVDLVVVAARYDEWLPMNQSFKDVCTTWQTERDHPATCAALAPVVERTVAICTAMGASVPWMTRYEARLAAAAQRFVDGDDTALTRPMSASVHDVWMELHQDLLLTLGRKRSPDDGH